MQTFHGGMIEAGTAIGPAEGCAGNGTASRIWKGDSVRHVLSSSAPRGAALLVLLCCVISAPQGFGLPASHAIRLATTTSMDQSGLLDVLLAAFWKRTGIRVDVIATGSGSALTLASHGDCDLVISHAPALEQAFLATNPASRRILFMYSDFVIVGPRSDPAGIRTASSALQAFRLIADRRALFISRGDRSGTHQKELELWPPTLELTRSAWYLESGQGMAETLRIADERSAYALSDRATFLAVSKELGHLSLLFEGDGALRNEYALIISPLSDAGRPLADFLSGAEAAELIRSFSVKGARVFYPLYPGIIIESAKRQADG